MAETKDSSVPEDFPSSEAQQPATKKKRNLPGMPDPDAEVIALSPTALLATNRFVCEICNKGFQRDQNLQLHRRGHNLPWKLKHRNAKDPVRKRVYICPEPTCVHHNPSRALGDLTGIKKHFCRKHGEKKWKCERCGKKYAVQSDWKAHMKTCGTKEYKCDCGTLFSRRDSFITHRAFCDALAEESTRAAAAVATRQVVHSNNSNTAGGGDVITDTGTAAEGDRASAKVVASPPPPPLTPSTSVVSPVLSIQSSDLPENPVELLSASAPVIAPPVASVTASSTSPPVVLQPPPHLSHTEPASLSLFLSSPAPSLFPTMTDQQSQQRLFIPAPQPAMSATALLQKAAQMGAAASNASLLRGLGLAMSSPSLSSYENNPNMELPGGNWWPGHVKIESVENPQMAAGLGLMSTHDGSSGFAPAMMAHPGLFVSKPLTVDFLGLGMGHGGAEPGGLSALLSTLEGGYGRGTSGLYGGDLGSSGGGGAWEGGAEGKPNGPTFL